MLKKAIDFYRRFCQKKELALNRKLKHSTCIYIAFIGTADR